MFHIHVMGCISFLEGYGSSKANRVMGKWFDQYPTWMQLNIIFANHPGWDKS